MNLIVSVALNGVIGCNGKLVHPIPDDLRRFKKLTLGCSVVMGRKTFQTCLNSRPLTDRANFVLTHQEEDLPGVVTIQNIEDVITNLPVWVIGGSQIYNLFLPYVSKMYVTHIHKSLIGDSYFLPNWQDWVLESYEDRIGFSYAVYSRK